MKRYELKTMSDMLAIPEDRFDEFMLDLKTWHKAALSAVGLVTEVASAIGEEKPSDSVAMIWTDDGKRDGKVTIKAVGSAESRG